MPQAGVRAVHAPAHQVRRLRRFDLDVDQCQPLFRLTRMLAWYRLARRQFRDEVEDAACAVGRVGEDFLVEPFDLVGVEPGGPVGEEQA
jgi:hypothetical protein